MTVTSDAAAPPGTSGSSLDYEALARLVDALEDAVRQVAGGGES